MEHRFDWRGEEKPLLRAAEGAVAGRRRLSELLESSVSAVCLIAIVALEVLHRFVEGGFNPAFTAAYIVSAATSALTSLLAFYVFFPSGKSAGRTRAEYRGAAGALSDMQALLRAGGLLCAFRAFCRERERRESESVREARLEALENCYVTREEYLSHYRTATARELSRAVRSGELTRGAVRQIKRCRRPVKTRPLRPAYFLSPFGGEASVQRYLHGGSRYEARALALKPFFCVGVGVLQSVFTFHAKAVDNPLDVALAIALSLFQICLASFSGYTSGLTAAEKEGAALSVKADFLSEFYESKKEGPLRGE